MRLLLIGAGGHARVVHDALAASGFALFGYVDPRPSPWLDAPRHADDAAAAAVPADIGVALGLGGIAPKQLARRLALLRRYMARGRAAPAIVHPRAIVSDRAVIGHGVQIMAGAIVQAGASLGDGVIVNTGAMVEHDSTVGAGAHVAPGAIVLGGVRIGAGAMIGAGAVVLPGAAVRDGELVPAGRVHAASAGRGPRAAGTAARTQARR